VDFPCVRIPVEILLGDKIQKRCVYFVCYVLLYGVLWIMVIRELLTCFSPCRLQLLNVDGYPARVPRDLVMW
jgi:hypothetical protein